MSNRLRIASWLTLVYVALLVAIIAAANRGVLPLTFLLRHPGSDKLGHFLFMGLLSLLVNMSLGGLCPHRFTVPRGCLGLSLLVGLEELTQLWLRHRAFEWADLVADVAGIVAFGALAGVCLARKTSRREEATPAHAPPPR